MHPRKEEIVMAENSKPRCGIGITGVVTAILIALKLAGIIHCSWIFALMPLFVGIGIKLFILLLLLLWVKWQEWSW